MKNSKLLKILAYSIIFYVSAFMLWWTILLIRTEKENFQLKQEISNSQLQADETDDDYKEFRKARRMIIYEAIVFFALLLIASSFVIQMLKKQEKFIDLKRNFLLATSHEFKTPLTSLKLNLQTLFKTTIDPDNRQLLIDNSLAEVKRLTNLVDNILLASKIDSEEYEFTKEIINLSELTCLVVDSIVTTRDVYTYIEDDVSIQADESSIRVLLLNLIDNAIKYSPETTPVEIELSKNEGMAVLKVIDEGVGIVEKEQGKIWERFYRIEDERIRKTKGTGLGLFLVKTMAEINEGSVAYQPNHPNGSIFIVQIPLASG